MPRLRRFAVKSISILMPILLITPIFPYVNPQTEYVIDVYMGPETQETYGNETMPTVVEFQVFINATIPPYIGRLEAEVELDNITGTAVLSPSVYEVEYGFLVNYEGIAIVVLPPAINNTTGTLTITAWIVIENQRTISDGDSSTIIVKEKFGSNNTTSNIPNSQNEQQLTTKKTNENSSQKIIFYLLIGIIIAVVVGVILFLFVRRKNKKTWWFFNTIFIMI